MTSLSITVPDIIANESNKAAKALGVSRTEFIRRAIVHELDNFKIRSEESKLIKSFTAMKQSKEYLNASEVLTDSLTLDLPKEEENWWSK